jgi:hypothetical protein
MAHFFDIVVGLVADLNTETQEEQRGWTTEGSNTLLDFKQNNVGERRVYRFRNNAGEGAEDAKEPLRALVSAREQMDDELHCCQ